MNRGVQFRALRPDELRLLARLPAPLSESDGSLGDRRATCVYRCFDEGGWLLYVGTAVVPHYRLQAHKWRAAWWPEVVWIDVDQYRNRGEALEMETRAIELEEPRYNIARRSGK